ncbi:MAG: cadmium-translocating P-type ATPase [Oscillibacter sp.]|nr:cadmium-translocating P-type ATPase [Oscillibacter sp.]
MSKLSRKERKMLRRILIAAAILIAASVLPLPDGLPVWPLYLIAYFIIGWDVLYDALRNIRNGQLFDENFLMAIATVGAFATAEYAEAVFVMLFYQTGELFQSYAVGKSRRSIAALMDIRPDTANVELLDGSTEEADPEDVAVGQTIVVKPGERVPLDGTVLSGASSLDTAALTGEAAPRDVVPGDAVISGCVNLSGVLRVRVDRPSHESTVAKILDLVENASEKKAVSEQFITRFARYYTPCVVFAALALAVVPPLLFGGGWGDWFHRALIFLVVSCPCALVISVPLSFFGGIGGASRCGILVKGSNYLETLARAETVVFDKTGTLTRGAFTVTEVRPQPGFEQDALLETAALAEVWSDHPISLSLRAACGKTPDAGRVAHVEEIAGHGVTAVVDGRAVAVGNRRLMERLGVAVEETSPAAGTVVHVAVETTYAGFILISDLLKEDAASAIAALKNCGVKRTVLLTGDSEAAAQAVAAEVGVDEFHAGLLPADKVEQMERILADNRRGAVAFVGDGINDAPVLSRADIGIAMGALGSDAAIEAADIVLMDDKPSRIAAAIGISRKTVRIVRQNIAFALGVKFAVLLLGALGHASMWLAVFADVGVAFIAILNAMRCLQTKEFQ